MKLLSSLLCAGLIMSGTVNAQIFINTGNPNIDKYKQDNNITTTDTGKVDVPVKTPAVNIRQQVPPAVATQAVRPAPTSAPATTKTETAVSNATPPAPDANMPPNAEVGKCYARCFVADKYETREETVVDKPLSYKTKMIPATYKTVYDTVITKAASVRTVEVPPVYQTVIEDVLVSAATQKWVKGTADAGCLSANPADCQVMCLKQIPAVYKKVARKVIKTPGFKQDIPVPAESKTISKRVIDQPARQEQIEVPATYKKVTHRDLVSKGGYSEWKEILCGDKLTASKIVSIQTALKNNGYDPGPLDDVFGSKTKAALIKYQQDKNLPVGNLNMETLKALGVEK